MAKNLEALASAKAELAVLREGRASTTGYAFIVFEWTRHRNQFVRSLDDTRQGQRWAARRASEMRDAGGARRSSEERGGGAVLADGARFAESGQRAADGTRFARAGAHGALDDRIQMERRATCAVLDARVLARRAWRLKLLGQPGSRVTNAPQPSDIYWENLQLPPSYTGRAQVRAWQGAAQAGP